MKYLDYKPTRHSSTFVGAAAALSLSIAVLPGTLLAQDNSDYLIYPDSAPSDAQRGGKFIVGYHIGLDQPVGTIGSGNRNVPGSQLNASLLRFNHNYEPVPYLATSWEFSDDGKQFNFELHPEARFHDGEDITCTDVAFSIKMSQENHPFKPMFAPVTSVAGGDTKNCIINLDKPHPALLMALSPGLLPIIPEHIYNDGQEIASHPRLTKGVIGSGPFKLVEWNGKDIIRFVKNEDFFIPGLPYLDEIVIDVVPDKATLTLGLKSGDYDMVSNWDGDDIVAALKDDNIKVIDKGYEAIGAVRWIDMNQRNEVMANVKLRKALAYATDSVEHNDIVYGGLPRRQCTGWQSQSPFYNPNINCYDLDIEKAKTLLTEAGYPDGLTITMMTQPNHLVRAEVTKRQWAKIGVNLEFDVKPDEVTLLKEMTKENATDWQVTTLGAWNWGDPVIGVHRSYNCDNRKVGVFNSNMVWYCNEEVDSLLTAAGSELDNEKRKELYFEAQELVSEDMPYIYLANLVWYTRMQHSVQNPPDGIWGWMDSWAETWLEKR